VQPQNPVLDVSQSKRARAIETGIFALGHLGQRGALATSDRDDPPSFL
jgi:hypothetical protein